MLEGSDVFTTHKLQINYRSNQEILDFANVLLENIEANQYARIQLQANSLKTVTEQSFLDAVKFQYHRCVKSSEIKEDLPRLTRTCLKPFIDECLAAKEQIALLFPRRVELSAVEEELNKLYPNLTIANITSPRSKPSTLFSRYIQKNWANLTFAPSQNLLNIIVTSIQAQLSAMVTSPRQTAQWAAKAGAQQLYDWQIECGPTIGEWQRQFSAGQITQDQFMDFMKENMLQYEIKRNATKQAMLSSKKRDKAFNDMVQNAEILVSTIHGSKGLEFPHTVLLFDAQKGMSEENKRMYYVGLTRAMKSEYVLAYNNIPSPKVKSDYETIIKQLHQRYPAGQVPAIPLVTGQPSKNQLSIDLDVLEQGVIPLTPGIMPECVIADPTDPIGAQRELEAKRAQSQFVANGVAAAQAQVMANAIANGQIFDPATGKMIDIPAANGVTRPAATGTASAETPDNTAPALTPAKPTDNTPPAQPVVPGVFMPPATVRVQQPVNTVVDTTHFARTNHTVNPVIPNSAPNFVNPVTLAKPAVAPAPIQTTPGIQQNPSAYGEMLRRMQNGNNAPTNP